MNDDQAQEAIDYLGRRAPLSLSVRPALPTGASPMPAAGQPVVAGASPGRGGGSPAPAVTGQPDTSLTQALGFGGRALDVARRVMADKGGTGPTVPAPAGERTVGAFTDPRVPGVEFPQFDPSFLQGEEALASVKAGVSTPAESVSAASAAERGASAGESAGTSTAGEVVRGAGAAASLGIDLANIPSSWSTGDQVAMGVLDALKAVGTYAGFGIPALVDAAIQLFGGPSSSQFLADVFGLGPSGAWQRFPQRVGGEVKRIGTDMSDAARAIESAGSPKALRAAVDAYNEKAGAYPGAEKGEPEPIQGTPFSLRSSGDWASSLSGSKVHGAPIGDLSQFGSAEQQLRQLVRTKYAALTAAPAAADGAPMPGGPAGGFSGKPELEAA